MFQLTKHTVVWVYGDFFKKRICFKTLLRLFKLKEHAEDLQFKFNCIFIPPYFPSLGQQCLLSTFYVPDTVPEEQRWGTGLLPVAAAAVCDQACRSSQSTCHSSFFLRITKSEERFYLLVAYFLLRLTQVSSNITLGDSQLYLSWDA